MAMIFISEAHFENTIGCEVLQNRLLRLWLGPEFGICYINMMLSIFSLRMTFNISSGQDSSWIKIIQWPMAYRNSMEFHMELI